jgi:hypothetical protein
MGRVEDKCHRLQSLTGRDIAGVCIVDSSSFHGRCPSGLRQDTTEALMRDTLTRHCCRRHRPLCIHNSEDDDGRFQLGPSPDQQLRCCESWVTFLEQCAMEHDAAAGIQLHPLQQAAPSTARTRRYTPTHRMLEAWSLFATGSFHVQYAYMIAL